MEFRALYLELIDSTQIIGALLAGISSAEARIKRDPSSWSVLETVCQLLDEERLDFRPRLDSIIRQSEAAWEPIDRKAWAQSHRYNQRDFRDVKERFMAERNKSLDWLRGLEATDWTLRHRAALATVSAGDLLASWAAHDNMAIRQLVDLRQARLERLSQPFSINYADT